MSKNHFPRVLFPAFLTFFLDRIPVAGEGINSIRPKEPWTDSANYLVQQALSTQHVFVHFYIVSGINSSPHRKFTHLTAEKSCNVLVTWHCYISIVKKALCDFQPLIMLKLWLGAGRKNLKIN